MKVQGTFRIRRYWLYVITPTDVLNTLNFRWGQKGGVHLPFVDIQYWGDSDKNITLMELRYGEHIDSREEIVYTLEGDDGLTDADNQIN